MPARWNGLQTSGLHRKPVLIARRVSLGLGFRCSTYRIVARIIIESDMAHLEREVKILNKLGLHARPAAEFVRCARTFRSRIQLRKGKVTYSATSILDVLTANLNCGAIVILEAEGPDAQAALEKLTELLRKFQRHDAESQRRFIESPAHRD